MLLNIAAYRSAVFAKKAHRKHCWKDVNHYWRFTAALTTNNKWVSERLKDRTRKTIVTLQENPVFSDSSIIPIVIHTFEQANRYNDNLQVTIGVFMESWLNFLLVEMQRWMLFSGVLGPNKSKNNVTIHLFASAVEWGFGKFVFP